MKKRKVILSVLLTFVLLLTISVAAACNPDDGPVESPFDSWALQSISVGGNYRKEYNLNEAFSAEGLTVSARMKNVESGDTRTDDVTANAQIDSGKFNSAMVGTYAITVSYTHSGVTRYAQFDVRVKPYEPQVNGISIAKVKYDYDIPQGASYVKIDVDDITVKAVNAQGEEEATALDKSAYTLTYYRGGEKLANLDTATKGAYTIQAERKSDGQKAFAVIYVLDPVQSIEFRSGTLTQEQALTDSMTGNWMFTVTNRSGTTHDVTSDKVELGSINSLIPGSYKANVVYSEYDAKGNSSTAETAVDYTVTKVAGMVNQSYAVNISGVGGDGKFEIKPANEATDGVLNAEGGISLITGTDSSGKEMVITIEGNTAACGSKSFTKRMKFGGKSQSGTRQIKLEVKGASLITVYAKSGSSSTLRGLGLYSDATVSAAKRLDTTEQMLGTVVPLTYLVDKAGTYYLAAPDGDVNIYYIQIDTVLTGEAANGQQSIELPTETQVAGITLDTSNLVKKEFTKGDAFTYEGLVVNQKIYNPVTADTRFEAVTDYTATITKGSMDEQGEITVTVEYQGKTATYIAKVNSLVDGVNGIKVSATAPTVELESADDKHTVEQSDFVVTTDSGAAITEGPNAGECFNILYDLYRVTDGTEEYLGTNWTVGAGTYKVKVAAQYNNSYVEGTTSFEAECTFTVKVKAAEGEVTTESFALDVLADQASFSETAYAPNSNIADNSLFTLTNTVAMKTSFGGTFGNLQNGSNAVTYTTMDGKAANPNQGIKVSSNIALGTTADSLFTVTAKDKITLYLYVTYANDSFNSNKEGIVFYSVNGGEKTSQTIAARKSVWTISVTLEQGQVLTLGATATVEGKLWLFGAEAVSQ
ncbi:MAG: bacterial Ig-like domain-containing protein [Corallococcus sp.]|nr:bacterial Ig-like domain-containing protein [Corallococcus sp.]